MQQAGKRAKPGRGPEPATARGGAENAGPGGRDPARRDTKAARHARTRAALLQAGRAAFEADGFAGAGTEAIVAASGVTRGALYYHFPDKAALFDAVVEDIAAAIAQAIDGAAARARTPRGALIAGMGAFLDACLAPGVRRIYLLDAPAVLGFARWRAIDAGHAMGRLAAGLEAALDGAKPERIRTATHLLSGALNEAVLWLADAPPAETARLRRAIDAELARLLDAVLGRGP